MAARRTLEGGGTRASRREASGRNGGGGEPEVTREDIELLLEAMRAARDGDFDLRLPARRKGLAGELNRAFNELADRREALGQEVARVGRLVGREGRLTERASAEGSHGYWAATIETLNVLIDDLVRPVTEVARVIDAVADGDLSQKTNLRPDGRPLKGEFLRIGTTVNAMVDQLSSFADEVTRVAREVGTEGRLGGQAKVKGVSGVWKDLTDNVNTLAANLTTQVRNIAEVTTAVANGDLSKKITVDVRGEVAELKDTVNTMVDQLSAFADEVTRVAREVGTDGRLGGQAQVKGVSGVWRDLTESVNVLASNLTDQVRNIATVTTAVANGDLSKKITVDVRGEIAELKNTINTMVDQLRAFSAEVTRVAKEVGTEGKLGGQADVQGVSGVWKELTDNVNLLADNLTSQVRNIAEVTTAVAQGDLSKKVTVDVRGEVLRLKDTINTMVDQLRSFASEVTRVAREVGTEGRLGGQANVEGVSGVWKDLTDNVNTLAANLTTQVRNIAQVTTAVANGDLSKKITVDVQGEIAELKDTINTMVDQLSAFAAEVTRVAREVGTEGRLGGQAEVMGASGTWRNLTENVNQMAANLTGQVRNIAQVATAVAQGDLSQKITVEARGEILELKSTINTMVDQLSSFADEVTRVAREVGSEGRLGGQARVEGVSGTWKGLTESVNFMAASLTEQVRNIADVTTAVANGDLSKKVTVDVRGEIAELKSTINTMVDQLSSFADEVTRVAKEVGTEGKLGGQASVAGVSGVWRDLTDNVNVMATSLTEQVRNIADVTTAVANGDLSKKITVDVRGEIAELKSTINTMVDQLSSFADEVTRVAREVGTEGKLGGQANVEGVSGTWRDLTDSVNTLADNLTSQVRNIAEVTTAVAQGDLSKKVTVDVHGEVLQLKDTINTMVDQLSSFAAELTRVAREVGTDGQLGGQAEVAGVSGVWRDLTENVNTLAATLTTQLRAIADVSTAVTQGDLTRSITVDAQGEINALKQNINQMIANLRATTERNADQDWLNSNLARFGGLMQGQRDLQEVSRLIMSELTPLVGARYGAFFLMVEPAEADDAAEPELQLLASYGHTRRKRVANRFKLGESLVGQAALERETIVITEPPADYVKIVSGLGEAAPREIAVLPVLFEDRVMAVVELATFEPFSDVQRTFMDQLAETIGVVINTINATMRTEELLRQSQALTAELRERQEELQAQQESLKQANVELEQQAQTLKASEELLQTQQEELQQTNAELEEKAQQLEEQNRRIEIKNREIAIAQAALQERAEQLALSSRYKSEFLANMSHELRTPLNSLLILAKLLADNSDSNLSDKQIEFARTIHQSGSDLLELINDILDLSKVEAGKMDVDAGEVAIASVADYVERTFRPLADEKGLSLEIEIAEDAPEAIVSDEHRLQQVLKNLLSNAIKFTEEGGVTLRVAGGPMGVAFSVGDTGIGVPEDKLRLIFEAFQQADGTTSRRYGGTGLGLSISREIARLLGGEITVRSELGQGSTFTLTLPLEYVAPPLPAEAETRALHARVGELIREGEELLAQGNELLASAGPEVPAPDPVALLPGPSGDDRDVLLDSDRVVLIVEDDPELAELLLEAAHRRDVKAVVATRGDAGIALAHDYLPDAVVLDMDLPELDGWSVLDQLKHHPATRHIPVHALAAGEGRTSALRAGAAAFVEKPLTPESLERTFAAIEESGERQVRSLLVVEDDEAQRQSIVDLVGGDDIEVVAVGSSEDALEALARHQFDCLVLDPKLPGTTGFALLDTLRGDETLSGLPVVAYTTRELTRREQTRLKKYADAIVLREARSPEQLLADAALFLHRVEARRPQARRRGASQLLLPNDVLVGRKVLIVDDDVRNVFSLVSVLETHGMEVLFAEDGREGLATLGDHPDVDLVLMDIMMPELDGYETIRAIRRQPEHELLPIISLTAKAMKGDRERSLAAGASDYITKPVDVDQLLSLMRVWLYA